MDIRDVVGGVRASKRSTFMVAASPNEPRVIDSKTSPTQAQRQANMARMFFYCTCKNKGVYMLPPHERGAGGVINLSASLPATNPTATKGKTISYNCSSKACSPFLCGFPMARREDFGDCKFLDSGFISDEESDDSLFSSATDLTEDDASSSSSNSSSSNHLLDLSLLMANLPIKRGLSQFFRGKSESFNCLSEVSCIEDLPKKNNLYSKRSKYCKRNDEGMHINQKSHYAPNICSRIISKKPLMYSSDPVLARNRNSNLFCCKKDAPISLKKM